ncbi:hypothetical protein PsYK624_052040 [Phanerochaete sordida]|uniref:Uncharacterized protein n=1 Tax=Phanerochaete sordida TaxID=48140 RepID=A0A9P3LB50_9APHY|nr:hypothetical protein PsYK624_052040 [Phanerochaete sordida]
MCVPHFSCIVSRTGTIHECMWRLSETAEPEGGLTVRRRLATAALSNPAAQTRRAGHYNDCMEDTRRAGHAHPREPSERRGTGESKRPRRRGRAVRVLANVATPQQPTVARHTSWLCTEKRQRRTL